MVQLQMVSEFHQLDATTENTHQFLMKHLLISHYSLQ